MLAPRECDARAVVWVTPGVAIPSEPGELPLVVLPSMGVLGR